MTDPATAEASNPHVFRLWEELGAGLMEVECEAPNCDWKATFNPPITAATKAQALRFQKEHRQASELEAARAEGAKLADKVSWLQSNLDGETLVEGTWYPNKDLHKFLSRYIRSSAEHAREAKALAAELEAAQARLADTAEVHRPVEGFSRMEGTTYLHCQECSDDGLDGDRGHIAFPCTTARALGLGEEGDHA